jgi:hypothetical protein
MIIFKKDDEKFRSLKKDLIDFGRDIPRNSKDVSEFLKLYKVQDEAYKSTDFYNAILKKYE